MISPWGDNSLHVRSAPMGEIPEDGEESGSFPLPWAVQAPVLESEIGVGDREGV